MTINPKQLELLIDEGKLYLEGNFFTSMGLSKSEFSSLFPEQKFQSAEYDPRKNEGSIAALDINCYFTDLHQLLKEIDNKGFTGNDAYVNEFGYLDVSHFKKCYEGWLELLKLASEYNDCDNSNGKKSFVIVDGSNGTTVLNIDFSAHSAQQLENFIKHISDPVALKNSCEQDDAHKSEKLSVLKTVIVQEVEKEQLNFISLVQHGLQLLNQFHKCYETYLRSFSFDEFVKDLEDDVTEYINKLEEQIQSFYLQALAVPGAVILTAALRTAEKSITLALVFSTLLALILVNKSIKSKQSFITRIEENTNHKLEIYLKRTDDISNEFAKSTIKEKINSAQRSIKETSKKCSRDMDGINDLIIAFFALYIITTIVFGVF